ncbi:MAG: DUF1624 domain-containing protein [Lachnospiraceae bacterium]|nr:DUF1624 domain-containing protein [Lachnospiraceae bacterium]
MNVDVGKKSFRYGALDSIRGFVVISMILYHACWDLVHIFGKDWNWYRGMGAYIWQQSICWSFILLSGFCWSLGKKHLKRGVTVFIAGAVVSLVTIIFMPENRVVFGVLTLIGSSMIFMTVLHMAIRAVNARAIHAWTVNAWAGLLLSAALFFLTRNINYGYLGFEGWNLLKLPGFLYQGNVMTFLGFTDPGFYSTDYFSFFPWFFLYLTGFFLYHVIKRVRNGEIMNTFLRKECPLFSFLGRHSLIIYMIHQPLIYGIFSVIWLVDFSW